MLRVWQRPGSRIRWDAGEAQVVIPLDGRGRIDGGKAGDFDLVQQCPVEVGPAAGAEISAVGDLPLSYLLISAVCPRPPRLLAEETPALVPEPVLNGHGSVANGHHPAEESPVAAGTGTSESAPAPVGAVGSPRS